MRSSSVEIQRHKAFAAVYFRWTLCVLCVAVSLLSVGFVGQALAQSPTPAAAPSGIGEAEAALDEGRLDDAAAAFGRFVADKEPLIRARAALGLGVIAKQRFDLATARTRLQEAESALAAEKGAEDWLAVIRFELASVILGEATPSAEDQRRAAALLELSLQGFAASAKGARRDDPALLLWQAAANMKLGTLSLAADSPTPEALNQALTHFQAAAAAAKSASAPAREADALFEQARVLWLLGDLPLARERVETARALFRDADDKLAVGRCQATSGQLWLLQGKPKEAAETFKLALEELESFSRARPQDASARERDLRRYELIISQGLAQALLQSDTPADAKPHLQRAKSLADGLDANAHWLPLLALAQIELDLAIKAKDPATSLASLASLCSSLSDPHSGAQPRCLLLQARLLIDQSRPADARPLLDALRASPDPATQKAALALLTQTVLAGGASPTDAPLLQEILSSLPASDPARAPLLISLARAATSSNPDTAHALLDEAQTLLATANDPKGRAAALLLDTELWTAERNWSKAKKQGELAISLLTDLPGAELDLARALLVTARMHQARGKIDDALELALPAAATFEAASDSASAAEAFLMAASAYDADKKPTEALEALEKALKYLASAPETSEVARDAYLSAARLQLQANKPEDALASLNKALKLARAQSHPPSIASASIALADLLISQNKHADALPLLSDALPIFISSLDIPNQARTHMALGFVYKATGDKEKAIASFSEAARFYDEIRGGRTDRKRAEAEIKALSSP